MLLRLKRLFQNKQPVKASSCYKLAGLSQQNQQLFAKLTPFIWVQGKPILLVYNVEDEIYKQHGVTLPTLQQLETLGLILFEPNGFVKKGFGKHTRIFYGAKPTKIGFTEPMNNQLDLGQVLLTDLGKELAAASNIARDQACYEYIISRWFRQGLVLSSIQLDFKTIHEN